ncbi:hypothetical protein CMI42_04225 [Candidatus Pacearchaeota archaeon]|nr:hypothetical protein [Candidatus Pacearchaeota archaeon]|tara:strand:- start:74 stop:538 length:465 start_codon:yes stop_codon:yes gene_type:complete
MNNLDGFINGHGKGLDIYVKGAWLVPLDSVHRDDLNAGTKKVLDLDSRYSLVAEGEDRAAGDGSRFTVYGISGLDDSYVLIRESQRFPVAYVATSNDRVTNSETSHLSGLLEGSLRNRFALNSMGKVTKSKVPYAVGRFKSFLRSKLPLGVLSI